MVEHVEPRRLFGFILEQASLTEAEHEHVAKCRDCVKVMLESSSDAVRDRAVHDLMEWRQMLADAESRVGGRNTLLIVDDEPIIGHLAKKILICHGFNVYTANSAQQALSLLRQHHFRIKLVITDYRIPDIDGVQLASLIQKEFRGVFVIIVSGLGQLLQPRNTDVEVVDKPINFNLLLNKIHRLLGRR